MRVPGRVLVHSPVVLISGALTSCSASCSRYTGRSRKIPRCGYLFCLMRAPITSATMRTCIAFLADDLLSDLDWTCFADDGTAIAAQLARLLTSTCLARMVMKRVVEMSEAGGRSRVPRTANGWHTANTSLRRAIRRGSPLAFGTDGRLRQSVR
jgi:hypothetical protein